MKNPKKKLNKQLKLKERRVKAWAITSKRSKSLYGHILRTIDIYKDKPKVNDFWKIVPVTIIYKS